MKLSVRLLALTLFYISCSPSKNTPIHELKSSQLYPYGRFFKDTQHVELISSASHLGFKYFGKDCQILAYLPQLGTHNYLQYEIDGTYAGKIKIADNKPQLYTLHAANEDTHRVWIYKATEAHTGPIFIKSLHADKLRPIQKPKAALVEFIGNSITCGAAADPSSTPCGQGAYHDQHNAYMAYGPRLARALGLDFVLSSVSGIGMYRNWNSDGPAMPLVYEKADFQETSTRLWDFKSFTPDVVSIALGTNDFSGGDGKQHRAAFDSVTFVTAYVKFVGLLKQKYPKAKLILLSSPIVEKENTLFRNCLTAVKQQVDAQYPGGSLTLHFFKPMRARGCSGHPNVEDHGIMADELIPVFDRLLK